ncbi:MAG: YihY/virulence factor BrkB family protein [Xenococcaceae cyanobacterium MO_188.B32]|nr:YihY/virulence factor BrkB family protein [Xenococcaceae cyanobacterium MO_188.B32]
MRERLTTRIMQSKPVQLIIRTLLKWQRDECLEMGAALAYYGIFSLFPLLLVILSVVGFFLGADTNIYNQLLRLAKNSFPPSAYNIIISTLVHLNQNSIEAGLVGFLLLLFTASNVFAALNRFVNKIWQVPIRQNRNNNLLTITINFLKNKISAFGLVLGTSVFMLLSLLSDIAIEVILKVVDDFNQSINFIAIDTIVLVKGLEIITILMLLSSACMVLFKILPATPVKWDDVRLGALITSGLFMFLEYLVSNSIIELGSRFLSYGVVGSVMILMLWIYLTCQIFLLGCEFTYVYTHLLGSRRRLNIT